MSPDRHHRFLGNRAFVLDAMLTDARENGLGFVGGDRKRNSDNSEVIAASSECSPSTMRWERRSNPGVSRLVGGPVFQEPIDVDAGFMGQDSSRHRLLSGMVGHAAAAAAAAAATFSSSESSTPVSRP